jgi:2-phospho-L-lactate/phosphoenolpyruvate guanylyltransferase
MGTSATWLLLPVKTFRHAKQRLAPVLDEGQRERLAIAMLRDVLDAACSHEDLLITVVTGDRGVAELAHEFDVRVLLEERECGTRAAVSAGIDYAARHGVERVLILPSDVPQIRRDDIGGLIDALDAEQMVIVPAERDVGTNALAFRMSSRIQPCYGENSFARHLVAAQTKGIVPSVVRHPRLGIDCDLPSDIPKLMELGLGRCTKRLLVDFGVSTQCFA